MSLSAGVLLGASFFGLLPEAAEGGFGPELGLATLFGVFASLLVELVFPHGHDHNARNASLSKRRSSKDSNPQPKQTEGPTTELEVADIGEAPTTEIRLAKERLSSSVTFVSLASDAVHNFIDGILLGATFKSSIALGWVTTLSITLHEIPTELGDFFILINAGWSVKKALLTNFIISLTAILGSLLVFGIPALADDFTKYAMAFAGGQFLYLSMAMLIPKLLHDDANRLQMFLCIFLGVCIMSLFLLMPHSHAHESDTDNTNHDGHDH